MSEFLSFKHVCPRCGMRAHFVMQFFNLPRRDGIQTGPAQLMMLCLDCQESSFFEVERQGKMVFGKHIDDDGAFFGSHKGDVTPFVTVKAVYPAPPPTLQHNSIPEGVRNAFNQGLQAFQAGADDLAIVGFRKAIDLLAGSDSEPLVKRIARLDVPVALREWAHTVREFGNSATHTDFAAGREAAREVMEFTRLLLEYHYVLPARVAELRASLPHR
jgi:hypothetical protein